MTEGAGYEVRLSTRATRELERFPPGVAARLRGPILALGLEPRPYGALPIQGSSLWRIRIGQLRIVYRIDDEARQVVLTRVARRSESTYRRLRDEE